MKQSMNSLARILALMLALSLLLAGCGNSGNTNEPDNAAVTGQDSGEQVDDEAQTDAQDHDPVTIMVAAAASLEYSYGEELIPLFQEKHPWITVQGVYDSSGRLQTQIEEGLAADVFMSAAMTQMNNLLGDALIDESSVVQLLENRIVLIVSTGIDTDIASFEDLANAGTVALGDPEFVPVGEYSKEALTNLGIYDEVAAKTSFGTNVTEVLNWVAEGSADAGIVYATDAATTENVTVVAEAPEGSLETRVIYPVGITVDCVNREAAELFTEFLQSSEAIAIFETYGFVRA